MSRADECVTCGNQARNDICRECLDAWAERSIYRHDEWNEGDE